MFARGQIDLIAVFGTIYFLTAYNLLLYGVNDIFDYESDVANPRKSGIEGALVAKSRHRRLWLAIVVTNLPFVIWLLSIGSLASRLIFIACLFMNIAYSVRGLRFKEIPVLDSLTSSTHFFSPLIFGLFLGGTKHVPFVAVIAFALWGMASHAFGAVQDIPYDRQAGIGSIATVFGLKTTLRLCIGLYSLAALMVAVRYGYLGIAAGLGLTCYAVNVAQYLRVKEIDAPRVNRGWRQFLWLNIVVGYLIAQILLAVAMPYGMTTLENIILIAIGLAALPVSVWWLIKVARQPHLREITA